MSGTDLVLYEPGVERPCDVVDVTSGELVSLDSPSDDLIALRMRLKELSAALRDVNRELDAEIRRRMDLDARWTIAAPTIGVKASAPSPAKTLDVPDPAALNTVLQGMLDRNEISPAAKFAAIAAKPVEYSVKLAGLKALMKRDELLPYLQTVVREIDRPRPVKYE